MKKAEKDYKNPKNSNKKLIKKDIHHISSKNHGIESYIKNAEKDYLKKELNIVLAKRRLEKILDRLVDLTQFTKEMSENEEKVNILVQRKCSQTLKSLLLCRRELK